MVRTQVMALWDFTCTGPTSLEGTNVPSCSLPGFSASDTQHFSLRISTSSQRNTFPPGNYATGSCVLERSSLTSTNGLLILTRIDNAQVL